MNLKTSLITAALIIGGVQLAAAQDKIHLRNGGIIDAKVKEVSTNEIKYKKKDNPDGPNYTIRKREVESITYANGTEEDIVANDDGDVDDSRRGRPYRPAPVDRGRRLNLTNEKYGKNIISLAPVQMSNEGAAGVGLHYERVLDKRFQLSVVVPVAMTFFRDFNNYSSQYTDRTYLYFYPGFKFYPTGSNRRISYALGLNAVIGIGEKYDDQNYYYPGPGPVQPAVTKNANKGGLLISNSLNAHPTKNLYLGLELGLGFSYFDNYYNNNNNYYGSGLNSDGPLVQFNFKIGYRF